jgi:hypothetical protein
MAELADLARVPYPQLQSLLDAIRGVTLWGVAYRYPALEDIAEPIPDEADLRSAIAIILALADRLRALASCDGGTNRQEAWRTICRGGALPPRASRVEPGPYN